MGCWKMWYPSGTLKSTYNWQRGLLDGKFTEYTENGNVKQEGKYKNGILSGTMIVHLPDGRVLNTRYKEGKPAQTDTIKPTTLKPIPQKSDTTNKRAARKNKN
jgi:antitoxin component YwqK of YwqJK toxin-antitoxin module